MQEIIDLLKKENEIKIIDDELDIELEIPHLAYIEVKKPNSKALLFTNPIHINDKNEIERFDMPVLMNLFGSFRRLDLVMQDSSENIAKKIKNALDLSIPGTFADKCKKAFEMFNIIKNIMPKKLKSNAAAQSKIYINEDINLFKLPILKTWSFDAGRFITMGQVYTKSLDNKFKNLGMYRLQVKSKNELLMHWQIHKDANHFYNEYKKANKKMPIAIAIGGDPIYTWCATAPMPPKIFELSLYGLIKNKKPLLVKCLSNDLEVPGDCDIIIEGYVDVNEVAIEGEFGDHTGFYTPKREYPVMKIETITTKNDPIFLATVVGKPPLEDKFMGYVTERVFLPLMQINANALDDYAMPENGVFHNLILASIDVKYPGHSWQIMSAFFGIGQMSFVKHALFFDSKDKINLHKDYKKLCDFALDRICKKNILVTKGICDELDHAANDYCVSGKIGIDLCAQKIDFNFEEIDCIALKEHLQNIINSINESTKIQDVHIYAHKNPIFLIKVKKGNIRLNAYYDAFLALEKYGHIFIFIDGMERLENYYMLIWRVVNNIDALRDLEFRDEMIFLDATAKGQLENYPFEWPKEVLCDKNVIKKLKNKNLLDDVDDEFLEKFGILDS